MKDENSKTEYILKLKKRHYKRSIIGHLRTNVNSDNDILKECKQFYTDLYKSKIVLDQTNSE